MQILVVAGIVMTPGSHARIGAQAGHGLVKP
jgi:hypothetical protein